ncbi:MAG: hypothetical protein F6K56_27155 [Moorea sp. SIO3G5]|nr:hypothetical protein [Moorena sp. SIO3G5]
MNKGMVENFVQVKNDQLTDLHEVKKLRALVRQEVETITKLARHNQALSKRIRELEEALRGKKKLNKTPQLSMSKLNQGICEQISQPAVIEKLQTKFKK